MPHKPLCFVLMPFGKKAAVGARVIDFDAVYSQLIVPAIRAADLEPLRADEESTGGIIHKPMFERLVLCDFAVADLTTANANVFYELGVRHAAKPRTTALMFAEGHGRLPFDVAQLRALPYEIGRNGKPQDDKKFIDQLSDRLQTAKRGVDKDSPVFQLLDDYPDVAHEKTDVFRERVAYAAEIKTKLAEARRKGRDRVVEVEKALGPIADEEAGVVVDLMLSYRAVQAWSDMIRVAKDMNPILANTILVREQLAFALNRAGQGADAEAVLTALIDERGPSSETLGILGRVYKDRWLEAKSAGEIPKARGFLRRVVETYRRGFETDWRDAYPGVNAITFMQISDPADPDYPTLRSVVGYAVERKIAAGVPDYWDFATRLELAVLDRNKVAAEAALADALSHQRESWEADTTLKNIQLIREARGRDDAAFAWTSDIEVALEKAAKAR